MSGNSLFTVSNPPFDQTGSAKQRKPRDIYCDNGGAYRRFGYDGSQNP
jgi:hypothetical protein